MAWIYLVSAGILEIGWALGLKHTHGFSRLTPSLLTIACMAASFWMLSIAMKSIPIGTAYAIWTGIGTVGVAIIGMYFFHEPKDIVRIICLLMIIGGIAGLKLLSAGGHA